MKIKPKNSLLNSTLYPHLINFKLNFTEKVGTSPVKKKYASYPNPINQELKQLYINHLKSHENCEASESNILFTAGCTEGIDLCLRGYGKSINNKVVSFDPVIPLFNKLASINDLLASRMYLKGNNYSVFPENIPGCSIVYICNPNNPTGLYFDLDKIVKVVQKAQGLVIIDETYIEFSYKKSCINLIKQYPNIIIVRSFSKGWGLAGLRAGVIIANPEVIINLQKQQLPFSVNTVALDEIKNGIINFKKISNSIDELRLAKEFIYKALIQFENNLDFIISDTNFIFIRLKNENLYHYLFKKENLFITDFSQLVPDSLRLSVYYKKNNLEFLNQIKYFLKM